VKLPRAATHIAHEYTLSDVYDLAVYCVRTDHWRASIEWNERVEAAWSAIALALVESEDAPSRRELIFIGRDASADVIDSNMRHRGVDKRSASFGETRVNFGRYWTRLPRTPLEDRVIDDLAMSQIWPRLRPELQEALIALATHNDYAIAARSMGLKYYTFCARVRRARTQFLRHWHEGETPSAVWGRDKLQGRDTGSTAVRVMAKRRRKAKADGQAQAGA
jgi:hypothetical protein